MTEKRQVLARQLGDAIDKIEASGWNRVHGAQLIYVVKQCADEAKRLAHLEAVGRADTLVKILGEFLRDTPPQSPSWPPFTSWPSCFLKRTSLNPSTKTFSRLAPVAGLLPWWVSTLRVA